MVTEIDAPEPPHATLTTVGELNYLRSYGVQMCQDNGLDEVEFDYAPRGIFKTRFVVSSEGFMKTSVQPGDEIEQSKEIQYG